MELYSLTGLNQRSAFVTAPKIPNIAYRASWDALEQSEGDYHWALIDSARAAAAQAGGKLSLSVTPGIHTPSWVYGAGAVAFSFVWDQPYGPPAGSVEQMPLPWDTTYLAKWQAFIGALGAKYADDPLIDHVVATGINSKTQETFLPSNPQPHPINGGQAYSYNDKANWLAAGYTPSLMEATYKTVLATWAGAFPKTNFAGMFVRWGFPLNPPDLSLSLIADAAAAYPSQFIAMNNGLSANWVWPEIAGLAGKCAIAFQTRSPLGDHLHEALNAAKAAGAAFVEVYPPDVAQV
ncbi:MAG TPA: hypothetical protein VKS22_07185 [Candidatus Binataceae bacterium]|nr:hypothetical protein [Candidatus Binataceae bacterium]